MHGQQNIKKNASKHSLCTDPASHPQSDSLTTLLFNQTEQGHKMSSHMCRRIELNI